MRRFLISSDRFISWLSAIELGFGSAAATGRDTGIRVNTRSRGIKYVDLDRLCRAGGGIFVDGRNTTSFWDGDDIGGGDDDEDDDDVLCPEDEELESTDEHLLRFTLKSTIVPDPDVVLQLRSKGSTC